MSYSPAKPSFGMTPTVQLSLVVCIDYILKLVSYQKEGLAEPDSPILLLLWHRLQNTICKGWCQGYNVILTRQAFFWYDTNYKIVVCFLHRLDCKVGVMPKKKDWRNQTHQSFFWYDTHFTIQSVTAADYQSTCIVGVILKEGLARSCPPSLLLAWYWL